MILMIYFKIIRFEFTNLNTRNYLRHILLQI